MQVWYVCADGTGGGGGGLLTAPMTSEIKELELLRFLRPLSLLLLERSPRFLSRSCDSLTDRADAVERGTDIEGEDGGAVRLGRRGIVVDYIAHFLARAAPADDPVVAIEGRFSTAICRNQSRVVEKVLRAMNNVLEA